jgi:hypothetical protein
MVNSVLFAQSSQGIVLLQILFALRPEPVSPLMNHAS